MVALFGKSDKKSKKIKNCDICGKETSDHRLAKDGVFCDKCYFAAGFPASVSSMVMPISIIRKQIESDDGLSIVKRFNAVGGTGPVTKSTQTPGNTPKCPKCGSESISADQKGFGVGKAVIGTAVAGPLGLTAGNIGAKKIRITCLNCGHQWMAGKC